MNRRRLLRALAAGTAAAVAGCTASPDDGAGQNGTNATDTIGTTTTTTSATTASTTDGTSTEATTTDRTSTETTTTDATGTADVTLASTEFHVVSQDCGQGTDDADVSYESSAVIVEGVASAANTCYTARLRSATYDAGTDTLTVAVETYVPEENKGKSCAECLVDIQYAVTADFEGDLPGKVVVTHGGQQVASAEQ